MITKYLLPLASLIGILFALHTVAQGQKPTPVAPPAAEPALAPFEAVIAGAGIVEAASENVAIGTPVAGLVAEVAVRESQAVQQGDVLLRIDDREVAAEERVRSAALDSARAELARLEAAPRAEDLPPLRARLASAEALAQDAHDQLERAASVPDKRAISAEELDRRRSAELAAAARRSEAQAELAKAEAGAWTADLVVARARVAQAEAQLEQSRVERERRVVRAPNDGTVLQVNVRPGEIAPSGVLRDPLILFGDVSSLHVRVDIDESEAWRLRPGARARATVRGNNALSTDLEFVRIDPFVLPKRSLTGDTSERVDTRVLQAIYRFEPRALSVYVGQQMDVFIEAAPEEAPK